MPKEQRLLGGKGTVEQNENMVCPRCLRNPYVSDAPNLIEAEKLGKALGDIMLVDGLCTQCRKEILTKGADLCPRCLRNHTFEAPDPIETKKLLDALDGNSDLLYGLCTECRKEIRVRDKAS